MAEETWEIGERERQRYLGKRAHNTLDNGFNYDGNANGPSAKSCSEMVCCCLCRTVQMQCIYS